MNKTLKIVFIIATFLVPLLFAVYCFIFLKENAPLDLKLKLLIITSIFYELCELGLYILIKKIFEL